MSSVYGYYASSISSSKTSSSSTSLGISGLVSGLDIDSTVKAMCSSTTSKITKVQQNLMKLEWKQEAYQDVGSALTDFKAKYLSSASSTNISSLLANCYDITSQGTNSKAVSASGSADILANFSILGVSSLASTASFTSASGITNNTITSGAINFTSDKAVSTISGKSLNISVGGTGYSLEFGDTVITDSATMLDAVNEAIKKVDGLSDKITASLTDGKLTLTSKNTNENITVNSSSNGTVLKVLGMEANDKGNYLNGTTIIGEKPNVDAASSTVSFASTLKDGSKTMTLDLDGTKATIKFDSAMLEEIEKAATDATAAGNDADTARMDALVANIKEQLKSVYGTKVTVEADKKADGTTYAGTFSFKTADTNSVLSVASGSSGITGSTGILGIEVGAANRLLTNKVLDESNFANKFNFGADEKRTYDLDVNGVKFVIGKNTITVDGKTTDYKSGVTMKNVMSAINSSDAHVNMSYLSTTDRFNITSTVSGASGTVNVSGAFADVLFGDGMTDSDVSATTTTIPSSDGKSTITVNSYTATNTGKIGLNYDGSLIKGKGSYTAGTDAKCLVSFDGNTVEEITRSTNSFKLDGLSLNLDSTFNASEADTYTTALSTAADDTAKATLGTKLLTDLKASSVTFTKSVNTEDLIKAVNDMVTDYNALIEKVTDYYKTKSDSDYQPLTSDMIEDENLTDDQAELYNDKAKEGILFGDSILRTLSDEMRYIFSGMSSIGITTSSDYTEYGKLTFDSETFKSKMESDTATVVDFFTNEKTGSLTKLDALMKKYVNSSIADPGLITAKAGLKSSSLSQMNCSIYTEKESLNTQLSTLKKKYTTQSDRYYSQFTNMEVSLSKLQSQSSYLSSMSTY